MPLLRGDRKREDKKNEQFEFGQKIIISLKKKLEFCFVCYVITMETHPLVD